MHRKPAPAILTATMRPQDVWMTAEGPATIRCPWCSKWYRLKRKMLPVHKDFAEFDEGTDRCPGSAQEFALEPVAAWVRRYEVAMADVAPRRAGAFGPKGRRQGRVTAKPQPPVPVPVCRPVPLTPAVAAGPCSCGQCKPRELSKRVADVLVPLHRAAPRAA